MIALPFSNVFVERIKLKVRVLLLVTRIEKYDLDNKKIILLVIFISNGWLI